LYLLRLLWLNWSFSFLFWSLLFFFLSLFGLFLFSNWFGLCELPVETAWREVAVADCTLPVDVTVDTENSFELKI
jgi:hypothetical protein